MRKWTEKEAIISPYTSSDEIFLKTQHFVSPVSLPFFLYLVGRKFNSVCSVLLCHLLFSFELNLLSYR